ncbi:MAG: helix-turn-helix domain-containing protein [Patescibacteria group bacterium]
MYSEKMKKVLIELGLTETESRVYLSMLKLGPASVQNIAKEANISRTAAYEIIGSLGEKSLASTFNQGKKKMFSAEDPEKLHGYFKGKMENMKSQISSLKEMVPELRMMQAGERPKVKFFTGVEGVRSLFRDVAAAKATELYEMADGDVVYKTIDERILLEYRETVHHKKVKVKMLFKGEKIRNPRPNTEYRRVPEGQDFEGLIWLYSNRIVFMNFVGDVEVVIIENDIFSETMKQMFLAAWECAKPIKV